LRGKWDRNTVHAVEISAIVDIVGIWEPENESKVTYILRKHPAVALLSPGELGRNSEAGGNEEMDPEDAGDDTLSA
jgi:hypothetical protein